MGSDLSTLALAAAGIIGTLLSPVITLRMSARLQRDQLGAERELALDTWLRDQEQAALTRKRDCYVALNGAARRYRVVQMNYLHAVAEDCLADANRETLEDARRSYGMCFAEAQMTASPDVLTEMEAISEALSHSYRRIRRLELGSAETEGSYDQVRAELLALWDRWMQMRDAMRIDLGVR